ncbi:MAG TPA: carbamoyltransferase C-terminal domain-containing protein [Thermoleophilaceae bacterium]|nr:carbamoyltransferase C-terminal domain-containing protein [Thermoleophilaceae bacterium]
MARHVLGVNAVFHDPSAALVSDGRIVAAAEEERFTRRKHGKEPVAFSTWELPERSARWCLEQAGVAPRELDAVAYSYDPSLSDVPSGDVLAGGWEGLRTLFVQRAPLFLRTALPGLDPAKVRFVPHHHAHAASAYLAAGFESCAVMTLDGRGERVSALLGRARDGRLDVLAEQALPQSLGLVYESLTAHLGFRRASDEFKVMALAAYGRPRWLDEMRQRVWAGADGGFVAEPLDWERFAPAVHDGDAWDARHADLAATVQQRLEEVMLDLARWLHERTGERRLALAGGVALNCVANSRLWRDAPFDEIWVQPAAGDAGTSLGAALDLARELGDEVEPMRSAALGRGWSARELEAWLDRAAIPYERPDDVAEEAAETLARNGVVAWFDGRSEFGPRALGHRSLLADPRDAANLERLNDVKGREQFRPVAPMVLEERAGEIFDGGPLPSPYMLFTHRVREPWGERIPAVVHVDGTARIQTVNTGREPAVARLLRAFERRTGVPVVVNTSLNTAGRPMVDDPRDALECFGSAPVDALVMGPFLVRRPGSASAFARGLEQVPAA